MARAWYAYKGPNYAIDLLSSYSIIDGKPGCTDGNVLCAIYALDGNENPNKISDNIRQYISNGLTKFIAQPSVPESVIFVAFKSPS